jgi:hypothetical protein
LPAAVTLLGLFMWLNIRIMSGGVPTGHRWIDSTPRFQCPSRVHACIVFAEKCVYTMGAHDVYICLRECPNIWKNGTRIGTLIGRQWIPVMLNATEWRCVNGVVQNKVCIYGNATVYACGYDRVYEYPVGPMLLAPYIGVPITVCTTLILAAVMAMLLKWEEFNMYSEILYFLANISQIADIIMVAEMLSHFRWAFGPLIICAAISYCLAVYVIRKLRGQYIAVIISVCISTAAGIMSMIYLSVVMSALFMAHIAVIMLTRNRVQLD